jgi:hypothetical protein
MLRYARLEDVMKYLRVRLCIPVVLLTITVTVSQLSAEQPPQPNVDNTRHNAENSYVGDGILRVLPRNGAAVQSPFPSDPGAGVKNSSPGRTYGALTAILAAAGGAALLAYLLTRPPKPIPPVLTSVTAGTPVISAPPGR